MTTFEPAKQCDTGGFYRTSYDGSTVYDPPCIWPVTHRYRVAGVVEGHWGYRCAEHVRLLAKTGLTIEPIVRTVTWAHPGADYQTRLPQSVLDEGLDSDGNPDPTSVDRRWLWRLEGFLAVYGVNATHRQMAADLKYYLYETCEHHWKTYPAEGDIEAHRQCSWCCDVEWLEPAQERTDDHG